MTLDAYSGIGAFGSSRSDTPRRANSATINASKSPSRTDSGSLLSTPVRRSLTRRSSRTYERICDPCALPPRGAAPLLNALLASSLLMLAACSTPAVQTRTVEVKIPVAVQPIKPAQVPAVPAPLGPRPQRLSSATDLLFADHCKWVAYGLLADPLLRVSAGEPPQPLPTYPECEK